MISSNSHHVPRHQHPDHEVLIALRGQYRCLLNDEPLTLKPFAGVLVKPSDWHEDICRRTKFLTFRIAGPLAGGWPSLLQTRISPATQIFRIDDEPRVAALAAQLESELSEGRDFAASVRHAIVCQLFWLMMRSFPCEMLSAEFASCFQEDNLADRLDHLFMTHLERDLSVSQMAYDLHMSESSLAHRCKQSLGVSPRRAFLHCKARRAAEMLRHTRMTCKEVAAVLGYRDQAAFSKVFKRFMGVPPTSWRLRRVAGIDK